MSMFIPAAITGFAGFALGLVLGFLLAWKISTTRQVRRWINEATRQEMDRQRPQLRRRAEAAILKGEGYETRVN